jgi:hypothetical protein
MLNNQFVEQNLDDISIKDILIAMAKHDNLLQLILIDRENSRYHYQLSQNLIDYFSKLQRTLSTKINNENILKELLQLM